MTKREQQERRLFWLAAGLTTGLYLVAVVLFLVLGVFRLDELGNKAGPILVKLGNPEAPDAAMPSQTTGPAEPETLPEEFQPETVEEVPPEPEQPEPEVPEEVVESRPEPTAAGEDATLASRPSPTSQPATPAPSSRPKTSPSPKASSRPPTSARPSSQPAASTSPDAVAGEARPRVYKGKDEGNNWELNTDREGVGFNLSPDLTEKMPIPHKIPAGLLDQDKTASVRQDGRWGTLEASYKADSYGDWVYNGRLATPNERTEIWQLLRKLGYDTSRADYLARIRGPARFIITVGPAGGKPAKVELDGSSERGGSCGAPDVDESLRQGLLQTGFSNNSGKEAVMRFTYSFK